VTVSKQDSRWAYLDELVAKHKQGPAEILVPMLYALADSVLRSDASNRIEAHASIVRSARTVEPMIGLKADFEWAKLSFIRKFQEGFDASGWKERRTDELLAEGRYLARS
jgi:hypothetical protein